MIFNLKKYWFEALLVLIIGISVFVSSWHLLHGNIRFFTDIARDFLLFEEIKQEKIVLLGPRASAIEGLFHGPLWLYMNMPAYLLGNGNPVAIGWFWLLLSLVYLALHYTFLKKITSEKIALIATTLNALFLSTQVFGLYNPHGAYFVMPFIIFSAVAYEQKKVWWYLLLHFFLIGLAIQFQMAVGVPILLLSFMYFLYKSFQTKLYFHLVSVLVIIIPLSSFILFDLRHDFLQTRSVITFITNKGTAPKTPMLDRLTQRVEMLNGYAWSIFMTPFSRAWNFIFPLIITFVLFSKKQKFFNSANTVYLYSFYLFIGFFIVSLLFNGQLMFHYTLPILPAAIILFTLSLVQLSKNASAIVIVFISFLALFDGTTFIKTRFEDKLGIEDNWLYQQSFVSKVFNQDVDEFGYFIFAPDQYAYETKAAMQYFTLTNPNKKVSVYSKKPVTYIFYSSPPQDRPDISIQTWKENKVKIDRGPDQVIIQDETHWIEKYYLTEEELKVAPDSTIHDWVYFR